MIKVLIVDDEHLVRIGLRMSIDWQENGFELLDEASNGKMALEIIEDKKPDIVITDIKMPGMDGIELIKKIREGNSLIKFIVLSGYNDFELVREAMKLGAVDYLLKLSLKPENLLEILKKVKEAIENENKKNEDSIHISRSININIDYIKDEFFKRIFSNGVQNADELYSEFGKCLKVRDSTLTVILAAIDFVSLQNILGKYKDKEQFKTSLRNVIKEYLGGFADNEVVNINPKEYALIINIKNDHKMIERICTGLNEMINLVFSIRMRFGISCECNGFNEIDRGYAEARLAAEQAFYIPSRTIAFCMNKEGELNRNLPLDELNERIGKIYKALGSLNEESIEYEVRSFFFMIAQYQPMPVQKVIEIMEEIVFNTAQILRSSNITWKDVSEKYRSIFYVLSDMDSIAFAEEYMTSALKAAMSSIASAGSKTDREEIKKVIRFLENNYKKNISLGTVAELVNLNEAYLSYVFSKEMGKTFTDYLTEVRIEKAKEYLKTSNLKVYEISEEVGYNDEHYFNKVFRKTTGKTPLEYRRENKNNTL